MIVRVNSRVAVAPVITLKSAHDNASARFSLLARVARSVSLEVTLFVVGQVLAKSPQHLTIFQRAFAHATSLLKAAMWSIYSHVVQQSDYLLVLWCQV